MLEITDKTIELIREHGILRSRDLKSNGIPRTYLSRLVKRGIIQRVGRGLYMIAEQEISEFQSLAEVSKRIPGGVICLLSALKFHELTTQNPFEVWVAIDLHARAPRTSDLPVNIVRFSGKALTSYVEEHSVDRVTIKVYSAAKTVADCFKFRNKIGLDVAIEALRDCLRQRKAPPDEIWKAARVCRVTSVIKPYMEALT